MNRDVDAISYDVVGAAIEVHKQIGPGLLERVYQDCLAYELSEKGYKVSSEVSLPVCYKEIRFDSAYRLDLLIEDKVILEIKSVERILPVHSAQLLSYLRLSNLSLGMLINFNVPQLKQGIKRIVNDL